MRPKVLDLFAGCGGLSLGFARKDFEVRGVDINKYCNEIFRANNLGDVEIADLSKKKISGKYDIIIGGPPCRPWSAINLRKRRNEHPDFALLYIFFEHVSRLKPLIFILENVPPARADAEQISNSLKRFYSTGSSIFKYSDFGAPTRRRRLFMVGFRKDTGICAEDFFKIISHFTRKPGTVRDAIGNMDFHNDPEHIFPKLNTIHKYMKYYKTGKYGWYILKWDEPAPSFGNIMKTYILHPDSSNGSPPRVISVREALCIMGFPSSFRFPERMPMGMRYQMIADAVSPVFSEILAEAVKKVLK